MDPNTQTPAVPTQEQAQPVEQTSQAPPPENKSRFTKKRIFIVLGIAIIVFILAIIVGLLVRNNNKNQISFCTQEATLCPDGKTYVSRHGPKCEFSKCPSSQSSGSTDKWISYQGVLYGRNDIIFSIKYPDECELSNSGYNRYLNLPVTIICDNIPAKLSIEGDDQGVHSIDSIELKLGKNSWVRDVASTYDYSSVYSYYGLNQEPYGKSIVIRYDNDEYYDSEMYESYLEKIISTFTILETIEPESLKEFQPHAFDISLHIPQNWNIRENNNEHLYIANHSPDEGPGEYTPNLEGIEGLKFYKEDAHVADFEELKKIIFKEGFDEDTDFTTIINEEKVINLGNYKVLYRETNRGVAYYYLIFPSYYIEIVALGDWNSHQSEADNIVQSIQAL